jgi:ribose transport system substrate-binding protein
MIKLRFLVSLITSENDYQVQQAESAEQAARKLDVDVQVVYAANDAITQSTQILKAVQSPAPLRPHAVLFEPAGGTALSQAARAAASAGIGWAVLNRGATYVSELRKTSTAPIFCLGPDQHEIGRIQGRQFAALLPHGGAILYIQGPTEHFAAKERAAGMQQARPANVHVSILKGQWTEESAQKAVRSWLKLMTSQRAALDVIAAQNDSMAMGARKAFQELPELDRDRWLNLPYLGCDGLPNTGEAWVRSGLLAATIFIPPSAGQAMEMLADALLHKKQLPESAVTAARSIPPIQDLQRR